MDVSTIKSWSEVSRRANSLYQGDETITAEFAARLDGIAKTCALPDDRLTEVVGYVQDTIRYVGEEMGEGSYVPRRPKLVLTRGYGTARTRLSSW